MKFFNLRLHHCINHEKVHFMKKSKTNIKNNIGTKKIFFKYLYLFYNRAAKMSTLKNKQV